MSIDIENCFNAIDRDRLIDECLASAEPGIRVLARYVERTYPPGMVAFAEIDGRWRELQMSRGLRYHVFGSYKSQMHVYLRPRAAKTI